ncbi:MAG: hypothetical protein Q9207_003330 [Kuettlingeria erythrocarpa]
MPGSQEGDYTVLWRKISLTGLGIMCPELSFELATGQWLSARRIRNLFNALHDEQKRTGTGDAQTEKRWNMEMGFFADLGGFRLRTKDGLSFPLDGQQLHYLVSRGHIKEPEFDSRLIQDKNKVEPLLRAITLCQILYFMVSVAGRWAQRLAVTTAELTTVSYIICSIPTSLAWWYKPADCRLPEIIHMDKTIQQIWDADPDSTREWYQTPLDYVNRKEWWWSLVWNSYVHFLWHLHLRFGSEGRPSEGQPIDRIPDTWQKEVARKDTYFLLVISTACFSVLFLAWNDEFPTPIERWLWRAACLAMMIELYTLLVIAETAFVYQKLKRFFGSRGSRRCSTHPPHPPHNTALPTTTTTTAEDDKSITAARTYAYLPASQRWQGFAAKVDTFLEHGRNNSPDHDPSLRVHIRFILPMWIMGFIYCVGRCYILLADLIEVRSLPPSAYETVEWDRYWPHLGS